MKTYKRKRIKFSMYNNNADDSLLFDCIIVTIGAICIVGPLALLYFNLI
jgi:hypothetical protein